MGIRFLCPHCDSRLNVKVAQAGLRGDCPRCQQLIAVPFESNLADFSSNKSLELAGDGEHAAAISSASSRSESRLILEVENQVTETGFNEPFVRESDFVFGSTKLPEVESALTSQFQFKHSPDHEQFLLEKPAVSINLGKIDPIAEAPEKVWYFRSRELGEKGPLKARQMQECIDCGEVSFGCVVWREDWEDWQLAERVFPPLVAIENRRVNLDRFHGHSEFHIGQRRQKKWEIFAISVGLLIVVGLLYLIVILLA